MATFSPSADQMANQCIEDICEAVSAKQWFEYVRKLGLSDTEIENEMSSGDPFTEKQIQMLRIWLQHMGSYRHEHRQLLFEVKKELFSPRNTALDTQFIPKLFSRRDKAWLVYSFIHFYTNVSMWTNDIVRMKFQVDEDVICHIKHDYQRNITEQKYQAFVSWTSENNFDAVGQIVHGLHRLGDIYIPQEYEWHLHRQQVEENATTHDVVDGPAEIPNHSAVTTFISPDVVDGTSKIPNHSAVTPFISPDVDLKGSKKSSSKVEVHMQCQPQIMISYSWLHREIPLQIANNLKKRGYNVWIDSDKMSGDILTRMNEAVTGSDIIVICMSHGYFASSNCKAEANLAWTKKKKIIPVIVEKDFKATDWLETIVAGKLYYDYTQHEDAFQKMLEEL